MSFATKLSENPSLEGVKNIVKNLNTNERWSMHGGIYRLEKNFVSRIRELTDIPEEFYKNEKYLCVPTDQITAHLKLDKSSYTPDKSLETICPSLFQSIVEKYLMEIIALDKLNPLQREKCLKDWYKKDKDYSLYSTKFK